MQTYSGIYLQCARNSIKYEPAICKAPEGNNLIKERISAGYREVYPLIK